MKRSEALARIKHNFVGEYIYNGMEEDILSYIERLGMLPPINEAKSWTMAPNGELIYAVHEWDDEEITNEELLAQGICPCGAESSYGCSMTGCALYEEEE